MALDSADKRLAVVSIGMPWRASLPLANGALDAGDRLQLALMPRTGAGTGEVLDAQLFLLLGVGM